MTRSDPVKIPQEIFERVSALCLALPEVTVRVDQPRVKWRSAAHSFDVRRRSFCLLIASEDAIGAPASRLVLRVHRGCSGGSGRGWFAVSGVGGS